ncbi:MAG: LamG-like jellyroll fold domain-containing protein [Sedimentisphaerales bacterium]
MEKKILCLVVCSLILCFSITVMASSVVGEWHFDDGTGTQVTDSSVYGNHGLLSNSSQWSTPGYNGSGSCLYFGGYDASDYVEIAHSPSLALVDNLYISAWVRPEETGNSLTPVLIKGMTSGSYYVGIRDSSIFFGLNYQNGGDPIVVDGDLNVPYDAWSQIAVRYDGSQITLYVNGMLDKSVQFSSPIIDNGESLYIGVDYPGFCEKYKGLIDEVVIAVPEPATILLFGIGGLTLLRKRGK